MRILIFGSMFFGVANYLLALSKFDHEFVWTPLVAAGTRGDFEHKLRLTSDLTKTRVVIRPVYLKSPDKRFRNLLDPRIALTDLCRIFRTLWMARPDAVVVFYVLDAYPIAVLKRLLRCSVLIVATGGDINLHRKWVHVLVRRMIYSQSDMILTVSSQLAPRILQESGREAVVVPTGVDTSFFRRLECREFLRRKWGFDEDEFVILTVSNLKTEKGVDVAIRTLSLLQGRSAEKLRLMVVGRGPRKAMLERMVVELGLQKYVFFLEEMSREGLRELYNSTNLFILSSRSEGLPFALLEAMACECVCVASSVGDIPVVLKDGRNGFLVQTVRPTDFAQKIENILNMNKSDLDAVTGNARHTVRERFDLDAIAAIMVEMVHAQATSKKPSHLEAHSR